MADDGFNDSTISFGGDMTPLRSISYDVTAPEVPVGGDKIAGVDAYALYVAGQMVETITFEVVGVASVLPSDAAAAITIAWNDGSSTPPAAGTFIVVGVSVGGSQDAEILSTVTCKRATLT